MDLSIRVIASILLATRVAPHQDTHTYRLSKLLKIHTAPPKKQAPAAKKRNYPLPTNTRQEEKRLIAAVTDIASNFPETRTPGIYQASCLLVAGAGFEPATFGL
jgi:hypothetical protein